ncbi:hypothetical protein [Clostridium gasigenes]|uniref:hypothetical protein n=1 Tax=Clostridium gasigenes TaxID=94869 RepID=UPI001C0C814C|nr:hypothetical protein [Clostridium gasigenes]MBU3107970.1 hypothetical protein [Clostridium gasigenes]
MNLKASNLMLDLKKSDDIYKCYTTYYIKILGQTVNEVEIYIDASKRPITMMKIVSDYLDWLANFYDVFKQYYMDEFIDIDFDEDSLEEIFIFQVEVFITEESKGATICFNHDEAVGDHWIEMVIDEKEIESLAVNG